MMSRHAGKAEPVLLTVIEQAEHVCKDWAQTG